MEEYKNCIVWIPNKQRLMQIDIIPEFDILDTSVGGITSFNPDIVHATVRVVESRRIHIEGLNLTYDWHFPFPFRKSSYSHPEKIPSSWVEKMEMSDLIFPVSNWFKKFPVVYPPDSFYEITSVKKFDKTFLNYSVNISHRK